MKLNRAVVRRHSVIGCFFVLIAAFLAIGFSDSASAGSAPGVLDCKSASGSITLKGEVPGDYEVFDLKIKNGKDEYEIKSLNSIDQDMDPEERAKLEENGVIAKDRVITLIENFKQGVFTMALRGTERYDLRLYALPGTIRARITPNSKRATFDAMLLEGDIGKKAVRMRCSFDHTI